MEMIAHQAVGVAYPAETLHYPSQRSEKHFSIFIVQIKLAPCIATRSNVIHSARVFDAKRSGHEAILRNKAAKYKKQDLTPYFASRNKT